MKIARIAAAALLVSCTALPDLKPSAPERPGRNLPVPASRPPAQVSLPREPLFDTVEARVSAQGETDTLRLSVLLRRPDFSTQRLELERIRCLRASAAGPGISTPILNLNDYVPTHPTPGQSTQLQISQVPRGKRRIVTVTGYDLAGQGFAAVPGATLKAAYDSPPGSTEVTLTFTWRSTAEAEVLEALQALAQNQPAVAALLDQLDRGALTQLLDKVIFAHHNPQGNVYDIHPARLNPEGIAQAIVSGGQIPAFSVGSPVPSAWLDPQPDISLVVRSPQQSPFANSAIQVRITDPASAPVTISNGSDTASLPNIIPGTWDAIVHIDGPNGGVTSRAQVIVSDTGTVTLVEGTAQTPIILPPVIQSLNATQGGAGTQITISGDGFSSTASGNTVKFGNVQATVVSASTTSLVVTVPAGLANGTYPVTVTSNNKTSNHVDFTVQPAVTAVKDFSGNPISGGPLGTQVVLHVAGFDPTQQVPVVTFPGTNGPITVPIDASTANTVTVTIPSNAGNPVVNGPIRLTLPDNTVLQTPNFTVTGPYINTVTNSTHPSGPILNNSSIKIEGGNFTGATSVTLNGQNLTFTLTNSGLINLTLPGGNTTSGPLVITTPSGTSTYPLNIQSPPLITNITPPAQSGDPMTLTGDHYLTVNQITINNQVLPPASYQILNNTTIQLLNPPTDPVLGPIRVSNPAGTALYSLTYKNVVNFIGNSATARTDNHFTGMCAAHGINVDKLGNIYVADIGCVSNSGAIHKFDANGNHLMTFGNNNSSTSGPVDGNNTTARFNSPEDATNDANNNIYVADTQNHAIRKITPDGQVKTLARVPGPEGVQIGPDGKLYITSNHLPNGAATRSYLLRIDDLDTLPTAAQISAFNVSTAATAEATMTPNVTIVAGGATNCLPFPYTVPAETTVASTKFCHLEGLGMDGQGNIYLADVDNYHLRKMSVQNGPTGVSTVLAKVYPTINTFPLTPLSFSANAPLIYMHEIRVDSVGNVFIPSPPSFGGLNNGSPANGIYRVAPDGSIDLIAGQVNTRGLAEGNPLSQATFNDPRGIDIGPDGSLYVADLAFGVRKIARFHPVNNLQVP